MIVEENTFYQVYTEVKQRASKTGKEPLDVLEEVVDERSNTLKAQLKHYILTKAWFQEEYGS